MSASLVARLAVLLTSVFATLASAFAAIDYGVSVMGAGLIAAAGLCLVLAFVSIDDVLEQYEKSRRSR